VHELVVVGLWRESRREVRGGVESARPLGHGLLRRGLGVLGYSDPGPTRSSTGGVGWPREVRCRRER
jgi:hypothetical protein